MSDDPQPVYLPGEGLLTPAGVFVPQWVIDRATRLIETALAVWEDAQEDNQHKTERPEGEAA